MPIPITGYAMAASRHMHQYGTTREHLAHVAVSARRLRGTAGQRQVQGAEIAVAHGNGGTLSSQFTTVFGTGSAA
jgi:acetyl-CoA acetyltransferase